MSQRYFGLVDQLFEAIEDEQDVNRVRELIEAGCDVNVRIEEGCTPLIAAVLVGNLEIVKLLVEFGADVNVIDGYFGSPLYYASYNGFQNIAEYLEPITSPKIRAEAKKDVSSILAPRRQIGK